MTVFDAQEKLLQFFLENDLFDPAQDFNNLIERISLTRDIEKAIYEAALANLTDLGIVTPILIKEKGVQWALVKPLHMREQTVEINFALASAIANTVNNFDKATGGKGQYVESLTITPAAVGALISIIEQLNELIQKEPKAE